MKNWISVKDKLPDKHVHVITCTMYEVNKDRIDNIKKNWIVQQAEKKADGKNIYYDMWAQGDATHWINMPNI